MSKYSMLEMYIDGECLMKKTTYFERNEAVLLLLVVYELVY